MVRVCEPECSQPQALDIQVDESCDDVVVATVSEDRSRLESLVGMSSLPTEKLNSEPMLALKGLLYECFDVFALINRPGTRMYKCFCRHRLA